MANRARESPSRAGASLDGGDQDGDALVCNGVKIGGSVYLDEGFSTAGAVKFSRATISGSLNCRGSTLGANKHRNALIGERMNVSGGVLLDRGFAAAGAMSLRGAVIIRELRWEAARPPGGEVSLESARAQQLTDNWSGSRDGGYWPKGRLRLAGFTYEGFGGDNPASVDQRLEWIRSQYDNPAGCAAPGDLSGHRPASREDTQLKGTGAPTPNPVGAAADRSSFATQPYKQLAEAYRRAGQDSEARTVEIARRRDLRRFGDYPLHRKALDWILDVTIRYGFRTWRVLVGLFVLYLIVFSASLIAQHKSNLIVPAIARPSGPQPTAMRCVTGYPCFYPAGYAVDLVVPLINIHQAEYWRPNGHQRGGWAWVAGTWIATGLGWLLATLLVVGYSGLARRE